MPVLDLQLFYIPILNFNALHVSNIFVEPLIQMNVKGKYLVIIFNLVYIKGQGNSLLT